jgi:hypothetical protein
MKILDIVKELLESEDSPAAQQAKKMGLEYLGWSKWGKDGKATHQTVDGKLVSISEPERSQSAQTSQPSFKPSNPNQDIGPQSKVATVPDRVAAATSQATGGYKVPHIYAPKVLPGLIKKLTTENPNSSISIIPSPEGFELTVNKIKKGQEPKITVDIGPISVNPKEGTAEVNGEPLKMSRLELKLLTHLGTHQNKVVSREDLLTKVWGSAPDVNTRTVDMYISRLKKKLGLLGYMIRNVRGKGYIIDVPDNMRG